MVWYGMVWYGMYVCMYVCVKTSHALHVHDMSLMIVSAILWTTGPLMPYDGIRISHGGETLSGAADSFRRLLDWRLRSIFLCWLTPCFATSSAW